MSYLEDNGVKTLIHYPIPIHLQQAYKKAGCSKGGYPVAEKIANEIISLPVFPQLREKEIEKVTELVNSYYEQQQ